MEKKPASHKAPPPPFQSGDHSSKDSVKQQSAREQKRELREEARQLHEKDWLAPAGSEREKQLLERWARHGGLSPSELAFIKQWIDNPDEFAKRNALFWESAKKSVLGDVVYETARERHRTLDDKEWLVACFTAEGMLQEKIAKLMHIGERMVDNIICSLKDKITLDLACDVERVDRIQIARWFFGL
jgi:hypothetical protein